MVLSIFANAHGFGYAVFEEMLIPVDWRAKKAEATDDRFEQVRLLVHLYSPTVIVLRDCAAKPVRCGKTSIELNKRIVALAKRKRIRVVQYSREDIRACFAYDGARTKDDIARAIAKRLPEFARHVPPMRKTWMSEDHRMGLFDALALIFTYYAAEFLQPKR